MYFFVVGGVWGLQSAWKLPRFVGFGDLIIQELMEKMINIPGVSKGPVLFGGFLVLLAGFQKAAQHLWGSRFYLFFFPMQGIGRFTIVSP